MTWIRWQPFVVFLHFFLYIDLDWSIQWLLKETICCAAAEPFVLCKEKNTILKHVIFTARVDTLNHPRGIRCGIHEVLTLTHLHYILYDWCPSGKIVRFILGTIPSTRFAWEETRLWRTKATLSHISSKICEKEIKRSTSSRVKFKSHTAVMIGTPSSFQLRMNSRSSSIFTCWISLLKFSSVVPVQWKSNQLYFYCKWLICWKYAAYLQGWKCRAAQLWSCLGCCRGGAAQAARSSWDLSPLNRPHPSPLPGPARRHSFRWFKGKRG